MMTTSTAATVSDETPSPHLHFGWQLDKLPSTKVPVNLRAKGLTAHIAIIAQSGSGKSFMLGRMLEEIAAKTLARFVILDPNSDFLKFATVDESVWSRLESKFAPSDTLESFKRRWNTVGFSTLTNGDHDGTFPISLSWPGLSQDMKQAYLGISAISHPEEYAAFQIVAGAVGQSQAMIQSQIPTHHEALQRYEEGTRAMWHAEANDIPLTSVAEWPGSAFPKRTGIVSARAALSLYGRIQQLLSLGFWDTQDIMPIQERVSELGNPNRVVCVDLGSLSSPEHGLLAAAAVLDTLWVKSREEWTAAQANPPDEDDRCPVFIVIDEAHNLAPAVPTSDSVHAVSQALIRIAMEGRKYGLFLILVTQRPSRLNENLLSQCDSLCLMKMTNPSDIDLIKQRFGFVTSKNADRAMRLTRGQLLLAGALVEKQLFADVAPRRTLEGGRSLRDDVWLRDPVPS
jgi:DNA helicase HerA-like ATPase